MIRIAQYRGKSFTSRAIKFTTRGKYSHTAIILEDGLIIEAWQGCNKVRKIISLSNGHTPGTPVDIYHIPLTYVEEQRFRAFVLKQVGKKYDYLGLLGFWFNSYKFNKENAWFCSELFAAAWMYAGVFPWGRNTKAFQVSPTGVTRIAAPILVKSVVTT